MSFTMIEQAKKQDILTMSGHKMILILRQRQTAGLKLSWLLPARARMPLLILALLIFRLMSIHSAPLKEECSKQRRILKTRQTTNKKRQKWMPKMLLDLSSVKLT